MAVRAGRQGARVIALSVESGRRRRCGPPRRRGQRGVVGRHCETVVMVEPPGDRRHRGVEAWSGGVVLELLPQVPRVETGETRRRDAVPFAVQAVTPEAGGSRAGFAAAHGDQLAGRGKGLARFVGEGLAARRDDGGRQQQEGAHVTPTRQGRQGSEPGTSAGRGGSPADPMGRLRAPSARLTTPCGQRRSRASRSLARARPRPARPASSPARTPPGASPSSGPRGAGRVMPFPESPGPGARSAGRLRASPPGR